MNNEISISIKSVLFIVLLELMWYRLSCRSVEKINAQIVGEEKKMANIKLKNVSLEVGRNDFYLFKNVYKYYYCSIRADVYVRAEDGCVGVCLKWFCVVVLSLAGP